MRERGGLSMVNPFRMLYEWQKKTCLGEVFSIELYVNAYCVLISYLYYNNFRPSLTLFALFSK